MNKLLVFLFIIFSISAAIFGQIPKIEADVSKELAQWRAANYSDVKFNINIRLEKLPPTLTKIEKLSQKMRGGVVISLFNKGDLIILDWRKLKGKEDLSKISNLSVNGRPAYFEEINGHLILKEGVLKNRPNTITFDFTTPIETGGAAARYIDENDNSEYLYCVPNAENDLFPSFNQPDIKARFQFTAVKLDSWKAEIITNSYGTMIHSFRLGESIYSFEETEPISANLFAFAAGGFAEFKDCDYFEKPDLSVKSSNNRFYDTPTNEISPKPTWVADEPNTYLYQGCELASFRNSPLNGKKTGENSKVSSHSIYVRKSQAEKFISHAYEVFRINRKNDKSAKLDIILLPEIFNVQSVYDGIKFLPESSVFK